ncbi:DNA helicase II [compost metagenome]
MVFKLYKLFIENPKILKIYQNKFKYLLVDESQDNNYIQYQLIKMLAAPHNNIFLVGDDDQSMYRFRGARPDEFVNFNTTYQNVQIINLERNYRSIPGILEIANNLIEKNTVRLVKKLMAFLQPSEKKDSITYQVASNMDVEATMVTKKINDSIKDGYKYNDNAIIYRVNSQSMALENELIREGIPYVIYGGTSFYERKEIKDVIAYLKLSHNPHDNEAFERVVNTPNRYLGKAFMNLLKIEAKKRGSSLYDALKTVKLSSMQHRNAMEYYNIIKSINSFAKYHKPERLLEEIIKQTKYDEFISKETAAEEDNDALDNIDILKSALEKYNLVEEFVEFHKKLSGKRRQTDAVKLMTIHKAKGLEFPIVHAVGQSEGLCPNHYAIDSQDPMSIEEERRLAYVLYTRAQKELHNYTPLQFGKNELLPSRFIAESGIDKFAG